MKNKTPSIQKSKSCAVLWLWSIGAIMIGVLIGIAILVWHKPHAYQPLYPDNPEQVSLYLTHQLGPDFFNQIQLDKPFELLIEQTGLNDIVSRLPWPQQFGEVSFSDPVLTFSPDTIVLMGHLEISNVSSILTIICSPVMSGDGKICLNIRTIRLGMVPVTTLIAALAQNVFDGNRQAFSEDPQAAAIVQAIIHNEAFDPVFWISDYKVRITGFSINPGILNVNLHPVNP